MCERIQKRNQLVDGNNWSKWSGERWHAGVGEPSPGPCGHRRLAERTVVMNVTVSLLQLCNLIMLNDAPFALLYFMSWEKE